MQSYIPPGYRLREREPLTLLLMYGGGGQIWNPGLEVVRKPFTTRAVSRRDSNPIPAEGDNFFNLNFIELGRQRLGRYTDRSWIFSAQSTANGHIV